MPQPIPQALRIAVKNAVGGWGPYSVRGIDDPFNSYGFTEVDTSVQDTGARRTTAERYQAKIDWSSPVHVRRYLDLIAEVLTNYPEDQSPLPNSEGPRLRRVLRQLGIRADDTGRLHLSTPADEGPIASAEGVWPPGRLKLFLSHISKHRREVGAIARELDRFGFSAFVAHDAIEPSRAWQATIEIALDTADALAAFVTTDFHQSAWTDQEVGWALGRGLPVLPLNVGANPYGFYGQYQAVQIDLERPVMAAERITNALAVAVFRRQRGRASLLDGAIAQVVVDAFCLTASFDTTRRRFALLPLLPSSSWTATLRSRVETAASANANVRDCILGDGKAAPAAIRTLLAARSS